MKRTIYKIFALSCILEAFIMFLACSLASEPDGAVGTYYLVYENGPAYTRENVDFKFILDGKGGGEYHKEDKVHKIKYKYEAPDIVITDNLTGIVYKGTVSDGKLHVYDGKIGDDMTSEFLFEAQFAK